MPAPVVVRGVGQGGVEPPLGGDGVGAAGVEFGEARDVVARGGDASGGTETPPTGPHDDRVEGVVDDGVGGGGETGGGTGGVVAVGEGG